MALDQLSSKYSQYQTVFFPTPEQEDMLRIAKNRGFRENAQWSRETGMAICISGYTFANMAFATSLRGRVGTMLRLGAAATFLGVTVWGVDEYVRTKSADYQDAESYF